MAPVQLVAIITPKPGKADRFMSLWTGCVDYVQKNEPFVHRYEMHRGTKASTGKEQFIIFEGYDDQQSMDKHMGSQPVLRFIEAIQKEDLTETEIIMTTPGPGIKARI